MKFGRSGGGPNEPRGVEEISPEVEVEKPLQPSAPAEEKVAPKPAPKPRQVLSRKDRRRVEAAKQAADVLRSRGFASTGAVDGGDVVGLAAWIMGDVDISVGQAGAAATLMPPLAETGDLRDELLKFASSLLSVSEAEVEKDVDDYLRMRAAIDDSEASEAADAAEDESDQITRLDVNREVEIMTSPYTAAEAREGQLGVLVRFQEGTGATLATVRTPNGLEFTFPPESLRLTPPPF